MEKRVLLALSAIFVLFSAMILLSANEDDCNNTCKVGKAKECLISKTRSCSGLSQSAMVFSALSASRCNSDAISNFKQEGSGKCWPQNGCTMKETSQTLLLLHKSGEAGKKDEGENWILGKKKIYKGIDWHLQIDSNEETQCRIIYNEGAVIKTDVVNISANKKITEIKGNGNCFTKSREYWLDVSDACYDKKFNVTCNKAFNTNNFYIKDDVYYIHSDVQSRSANQKSIEKLNSFCLGTGNRCDYEGTLWGAYALGVSKGGSAAREINKQFLPYLTMEAENNDNLLPEAMISETYDSSRNENRWGKELESKQHSDGYWSINGNNFYGTAIAYAGNLIDAGVKKKARGWILNNQDAGEEKCWNGGDIEDTGLILHNVFEEISPGDLDEPDTQAPSVTIRYPRRSESYNGNLAPENIKYRASDDKGLNKCWYHTARTGKHSSDADCSGARNENDGFPYVPSVEGSNTWTVYATDRAGNEGKDTVTFTINTGARDDAQKPKVNITWPLNRTYRSHKNELRYEVSDNVGAIACWYSKDNGRENSTFQNCSSGEMNPRSTRGRNTWTVYAMDRKGNIGSKALTFTIDAEDDDTNDPGRNPEDPSGPTPGNGEDDISTLTQCENQGHQCLGTNSCSANGGTPLRTYSCSGTKICCRLPACESTTIGGIICNSSQDCEGGRPRAYVSGLSPGQKCCTGTRVTCKRASNQNEESDDEAEDARREESREERTECERNGGQCSNTSTGCGSNKNSDPGLECDSSNEICCVRKNTRGGGGANVALIVTLVVLIILAVLGIIFREKVKLFLDKIRKGKGGGGDEFQPDFPGGPPGEMPPPGMMPEMEKSSEMDDVLAKLKNMGG